ncbi:MAG TPA: hypothetical protein VF981_15755 [Gemmatimonadaceae bacterium]
MKTILGVLGGLLVLVGVLAFAGVGITTEKSSINIGSIEASVKEERTLPPAVAGVAIVAGILLITAAARKSR